MNMWQKITLGVLCVFALIPVSAHAEALLASPQTTEEEHIYMFGRDDCGVCQLEKEWLQEEGLAYTYYNITEDASARELFYAILEKHNASKVTPLTVVGDKAFVGFDSPRTTGEQIRAARSAEHSATYVAHTPEEHLLYAPVQNATSGAGCSEGGCSVTEPQAAEYVFELPFFGVVDLRSFSLFMLSVVLGIIDGFNPCAMWVLVTFLAILLQAGSKRNMVVFAGVFILAEAVMYNLILNVWYQTWDFIALDRVVTPLIGLLALGGGGFFLYRWWSKRGQPLTCDISSPEKESKMLQTCKKIATQPLTLVTFVAVLLLAFSVNIVEFACSVGIPQAYTKILEMNMLGFFERQWYIFLYTLAYMLDDVVVFGLAIWGYGKLSAHGYKYAQLSLLVGGVLMLLLGALMLVAPEMLVL